MMPGPRCLLGAAIAWLVLIAPASANHIVMHGGPFNGVVVGLLPHPSERETLYLAAFGGGIYKSDDGGRRWATASRGLEDLAVLSLAMDPVSPKILYAGTDSGVFVSRNGGETWSRPRPVMPDLNIRNLTVVPNRPTVLYAATDQGVLWSWDQGATWAPRSSGIGSRDVRVLRLDPSNSARLFAGGFGGVFRSDDEGRHWRAVNRGLADLRVRALVLDPARSDTLYAGTAGGGVFVTTDGGATWRADNEGLRNLTVLSLLVTPDGTRYAGTVGGVYRRSRSEGAWQLLGEDVLTLTVTFVTSNPHRDGLLYAGTGGLVFISEDRGRHWRELAVSVTNPVAGPDSSAGTGHSAAVHSPNERR